MMYKDWEIQEIFQHGIKGKSDFQIYPPHGEHGLMRPRTTLQEIIEEIDAENIPELEAQVTTLTLERALAANLLKVYVESMEVIFQDNADRFSDEDWDNVIQACNFLHRVTHKNTYRDFINRIEEFIISKS